jgi:SAM-dependent methyltransferase
MRAPQGGFQGWLAMRVMAVANRPSIAEGIKRLNLESTDTFVELGAGHGEGLKCLEQTTVPKRVVCVEISSDFRAELEKVKGQVSFGDRVEIYPDDCKHMPFLEDNSVDKMFAMNVVYFLDPLQDYLSEIYRVLRPGGVIVFGCKFALLPHDDIFVNTKEEVIVEKMVEAGFKVETAMVDKGGAKHTEITGRKEV